MAVISVRKLDEHRSLTYLYMVLASWCRGVLRAGPPNVETALCGWCSSSYERRLRP